MSSRGVQRDFQQILRASCVKPCPISFQSHPKDFTRVDGSTFSIRIIDGIGLLDEKSGPPKSQDAKGPKKVEDNIDQPQNDENPEIPSKTEEEEEKKAGDLDQKKLEEEDKPENDKLDNSTQEENQEESFDRTIDVIDREVVTDIDDPFVPDVITIAEHLKTTVGQLYDVTALGGSFKFGVKEEGHVIFLLEGTIKTTSNGFTQRLLRDIPDGEEQLNDFLTNELSSTPNTSRCATDLPSCTHPNYLAPRIFVVLYKARRLFPKVDGSRLYRIIKNRLQCLNSSILTEKVPVCIGCMHIYIAEERKKQGSKQENKLGALMEPPLFESLTPAELSLKGKADVGKTNYMHKPYSFGINIMENPYRSKLPIIKVPPPPRRSETAQIQKGEKWVERLTSPFQQRTMTVDLMTDRQVGVVPHEPPESLPEVKTRKSYSEKLAPKVYTSTPFTYSFLDKVKEKNLLIMKKTGVLKN